MKETHGSAVGALPGALCRHQSATHAHRCEGGGDGGIEGAKMAIFTQGLNFQISSIVPGWASRLVVRNSARARKVGGQSRHDLIRAQGMAVTAAPSSAEGRGGGETGGRGG
eukprot:COSAG01_NODE_5011_length_4543_cov_2.507876_2_plen_111_part_00